MNYSTAVFLINDKVRAVYGTYEAGERAAKTMFKTFDASPGINQADRSGLKRAIK